jgi:F-type H+-transporting ATPase subunit delta
MNDSKISVRYAKTLYLASGEAGLLLAVGEDVRRILLLIQQSPEFREFLNSAVISRTRKADMLRQILESELNELTMRFVLMVTENRRESYLAAICRNFTDLFRNKMGITPVVLTTAQQLSPEILEKIRKSISLETGTVVEIAEKIRPEIVGGLILRIGDQQFDGSVSGRLKKVKEELLRKELF